MNPRIVFVALAIFFCQAGEARAGNIPAIEQSIFHAAPPFENIKQTIYVRERERPLLDLITDASTSLAHFLIDVHAMSPVKPASTKRDFTGAQGELRLPPMATSAGNWRYVGSMIYCWKSKDNDHLEFLIEWGDITTNARYTDSYVFIRRGSSWGFEKHGNISPWYWTQNETYFQRACPTTITE